MPELFLKARWENLILATYKVEPALLLEHLPTGLELDTVGGSAFVSLVAFEFNGTKVKGLKFPFHANFPEINLRFYVKDRKRRGVVFIREFVPRYFIAKLANVLFNENYMSVPMATESDISIERISSSYEMNLRGKKFSISVEAKRHSYIPRADTAEHFFKEHEWGFGKTRNGSTLVYRVEHPFWGIYPIIKFKHNFDFGIIYGEKWKFLNYEEPYNIVFAKGSVIKVYSAEKHGVFWRGQLSL